MWNTDIKQAVQGKYYPIWVKTKEGHELSICATLVGNVWYSNNETLSFYGFDFIAWFDLPPYRVA